VYEVDTVPAGGTTLTDIERTVFPSSVLLRRGEHTTDVEDYVRAADRAWSGGTGPWRGFFPYETPESRCPAD
jgi:hypothetical protein